MIPKPNSIFIASDFHLGVPNAEASRLREKKIVAWLERIAPFAESILLLGDIFDFWFEYRHVVPKNYVRLLGTLARLRDSGIDVQIFSGNHDLWLRDYFPQELGVPVFHTPQQYTWFSRKYLVAHGDGLGPGDTGFKLMKKGFQNPLLQFLFRSLIHPDWGIGIANYFSQKSRKAHQIADSIDYGEKEMLYQYVQKKIQETYPIDCFVFGHRHFPKIVRFSEKYSMVILGDWINHFSYLQITNESRILFKYEAGSSDIVLSKDPANS